MNENGEEGSIKTEEEEKERIYKVIMPPPSFLLD